MTFKARVLGAFGVQCVLMALGSFVLAQLEAPDAYGQVLIGLVGIPVTLYVVWAILRERDELEREQRL